MIEYVAVAICKTFAMRGLLLITFLCIQIAVPGHASEKVTVCARYSTSSGWSKGYSVQATVMKGTELIQATGSFDYVSYATYVVIFWDKDETSVIQLDFPALSAVPMQGKDQQGRKWEVAKINVCLY